MSKQNNKIERNCIVCNKIFYVKLSTIKIGNGIFCSKKCRGIERIRITNSSEHFWTQIYVKDDNNVCWEWKKYKDTKKYGRIRLNNKNVKAHRRAYFLTFPEQDTEENQKLLILHKCDNPPCCNPYHLKLGTQQDNIDDMIQKNRKCILKGENNGRAKLDEFDVKQILLLKGILKTKTIAEMYKVTYCTIYRIFNNKLWKHLSIEK